MPKVVFFLLVSKGMEEIRIKARTFLVLYFQGKEKGNIKMLQVLFICKESVSFTPMLVPNTGHIPKLYYSGRE